MRRRRFFQKILNKNYDADEIPDDVVFVLLVPFVLPVLFVPFAAAVSAAAVSDTED